MRIKSFLFEPQLWQKNAVQVLSGPGSPSLMGTFPHDEQLRPSTAGKYKGPLAAAAAVALPPKISLLPQGVDWHEEECREVDGSTLSPSRKLSDDVCHMSAEKEAPQIGRHKKNTSFNELLIRASIFRFLEKLMAGCRQIESSLHIAVIHSEWIGGGMVFTAFCARASRVAPAASGILGVLFFLNGPGFVLTSLFVCRS
jgi:hypothetical protein